MPPPEQLTITKEDAALLSSVLNIGKPRIINPDEFVLEYRRLRKLKVEPTLLSSIHELDMIDFKHRIVPDLANLEFPLEDVNDELEEGIVLSSSYEEVRPQAIIRSETEVSIPKSGVYPTLGSVEAAITKLRRGSHSGGVAKIDAGTLMLGM